MIDSDCPSFHRLLTDFSNVEGAEDFASFKSAATELLRQLVKDVKALKEEKVKAAIPPPAPPPPPPPPVPQQQPFKRTGQTIAKIRINNRNPQALAQADMMSELRTLLGKRKEKKLPRRLL